MKLAFFGSPALALPVLEALRRRHDVALVVAQPDRPAGRGLKLRPPPVVARAHELGLPFAQPTRLRGESRIRARLLELGVEAAVTCAYGRILPPELLEVPPRGFLNVHASLLPRLRGAAPIQWSLINGDEITGVTIMRTDAGLDTGPTLLQGELPIDPDWTSLELGPRLAELGAALILEALERLDELPRVPQDDSLATHAPPLVKDDGRVRWADTARAVRNRHRGVAGWPGTWLERSGARLKVHDLREAEGSGLPGEVLSVGPHGVRVAAGEGAVDLVVVQPEAKGRMRAADWARGNGLGPRSVLG